jgi:indole-3-glycerol phosphate synthase
VSAPASDLLGAIVAATRRIVEVRQEREPIAALAKRAAEAPASAGCFIEALSRPNRVNVIAECKRRSPSRGVLRAEYDAVAIARCYADAGAAAISVLTEPTFFDGALEHLSAVRKAVSVPLLRKDFIVSDYQLLEARTAGADAVLLILSALPTEQLKTLAGRAAALGLDVLFEVHDEDEVERALACGARIIGVNNRNLRTLTVDVGASERLIAKLPREVVAVSESGIKRREDIDRLGALGYRAFLIGEQLMTAPDPGEQLRSLIASPATKTAAHAGAESPRC